MPKRTVTKTEQRPYEKKPMGHVWLKDEDGRTDIFAHDAGTHNGPRCVNCGYGFCHHCRELPEAACSYTLPAGRGRT